MPLNLLSFVGFFALCGIAWLTSENRRLVPWQTVIWGLGLQLLLGLLVFLLPVTRLLVVLVSDAVNAVLNATEAGARFLFGSLLVPSAATSGPVGAGRWIARAIAPPYVPVVGDRLGAEFLDVGYIFAFRALPSVIFFSALMSLLYALGLVQPIVNLFAQIFRRTMRLSGAEALSGASNIFVGIEALVVVRPYLERMTRSELCAILTSCFGSIASTVLALYAGLLRPTFPNITGHLVSASIMAIPACFVVSKILVPETEVPETLGTTLRERSPNPETIVTSATAAQFSSTTLDAPLDAPETVTDSTATSGLQFVRRVDESDDLTIAPVISPLESIVAGALDGVKLAVAIAALLIAVLGLVALVNLCFANLASLAGSAQPLVRAIGNLFKFITLENLAGALFVPLTFLTGVSLKWQELWQTSLLLGQRLLVTEVPSYQQLGVLASQGAISDRALLVTSYALCGFAHIPSLGIFVGGLVGLAPSRRRDITSLSFKALWAATLATLMLGCIAGLYDTGNPTILGR